MKALEQIDSQYIIGFDIETVRIVENYDDLSEAGQTAWEHKNKQDGEIPDHETLKDLWNRTSSLYSPFSKICCISVAYPWKDTLVVKNFVSTSEVEILREFSQFLNNVQQKNSEWRLVGHASKFFDTPFISQRYLINSMEIPPLLDESDAKPWEKKILCTNELWRSFGTGAGSSLNALCFALGIPSPKVDLVGDEVGKAYFDGELIRIANYCNLDAISTYNIVKRFKLEPIFEPENIKFQNTGEVIVAVPLLEAIRNTRNITAAQKKEIQTYCGTIVADEVMNVKRILKAAVTDENGKIKPALEKLIDSL